MSISFCSSHIQGYLVYYCRLKASEHDVYCIQLQRARTLKSGLGLLSQISTRSVLQDEIPRKKHFVVKCDGTTLRETFTIHKYAHEAYNLHFTYTIITTALVETYCIHSRHISREARRKIWRFDQFYQR